LATCGYLLTSAGCLLRPGGGLLTDADVIGLALAGAGRLLRCEGFLLADAGFVGQTLAGFLL